jgi:hypothetical protein
VVDSVGRRAASAATRASGAFVRAVVVCIGLVKRWKTVEAADCGCQGARREVHGKCIVQSALRAFV